MVRKLDWAEWLPQKNAGLGNGEFNRGGTHPEIGGRAVKVVLIARNLKTPAATMDYPTHISFNPNTGKTWQHVDLNKPAYRLKVSRYTNPRTGKSWTIDTNKDSGYTIQVDLLDIVVDSTGKYLKYWDNYKLRRLAFVIARLYAIHGGKGNIAFSSFRAKSSDTEASRKTWSDWVDAYGVFGMMHSPFDVGLWSPGWIDNDILDRLKKYVKDPNVVNANSPSTAVSGSSDTYVPEAARPGQGDSTNTNEAAGADDAAGGDQGTPVIAETDMVTKPFRFNPPLHSLSRPYRLDFALEDPSKEYYNQYFADVVGDVLDYETLSNLRLGRIVQHEKAAGMAALNPFRYGLRFLYNPNEITIATGREDSVVIDPRSTTNAVLSGIDQDFQTIRFKILLNRMADVMGNALGTSDYSPPASQEDVDGIKKYGTHWDMEYLYRVCNGTFTLKDRGRTADIGVLIPSNARLVLGPGRNYFGFVENIEWDDQIYSVGMIPALTEVTITFRRHVDMLPESLTSFWDSIQASGVGGSGGGDSSGSGTTTTGGSGGNFPQAPGEGGSKPQTVAAMREIWSRWGPTGNKTVYSVGGYRKGDPEDHGKGLACDVMISQYKTDAGRAAGDLIANWAFENRAALKVSYIIWRQKIWNQVRDAPGYWPTNWRHMDNRGGDTRNHYDHVHISFLP